MQRARTILLTTCLVAAAGILTGCGDSGGYAPSSYGGVGAQPASAEIGEHNSVADRLFGGYTPPSSALNDTSITDSVDAGYGSVPGASLLDDADLTDLGLDDDPFDRVGNGLAGDEYGGYDTLGMYADPMGDLGAPTWDAALSDAGDLYGDVGGFDDLGLDAAAWDDPMLDDASMEDPWLDDPAIDAVGLEDPMLDDPGFDTVGLEDPGFDVGMDDPGLDMAGFDEPVIDDVGFDEPVIDGVGLDDASWGGDLMGW